MTDNFWKGAFAPMQKKITMEYTYVPVGEMTEGDWDWLDYMNLSTAAQNKIAKVVSGDQEGNCGIAGFHKVLVPGGKRLYMVPVVWPEDIDPQPADPPFKNGPSDVAEAEEAKRIRGILNKVIALDEEQTILLGLLAVITKNDKYKDLVLWGSDARVVALTFLMLRHFSLTNMEKLLDELIRLLTGEVSIAKWIEKWTDPEKQKDCSRTP